MNWQGIIIGISAFLIIGIFHPIVVKGEYYFSKKNLACISGDRGCQHQCNALH